MTPWFLLVGGYLDPRNGGGSLWYVADKPHLVVTAFVKVVTGTGQTDENGQSFSVGS